jgi:hypothetical protein
LHDLNTTAVPAWVQDRFSAPSPQGRQENLKHNGSGSPVIPLPVFVPIFF